MPLQPPHHHGDLRMARLLAVARPARIAAAVVGGLSLSLLVVGAHSAFSVAEEVTATENDMGVIVLPKGTLEPVVALHAVDGVKGFTTFLLYLRLACAGGHQRMVRSLASLGFAGDVEYPQLLPPAFQTAYPFGANIEGVSPELAHVKPEAQFDSWLTIGSNKIERGGGELVASTSSSWGNWTYSSGATMFGAAVVVAGSRAGAEFGKCAAPNDEIVINRDVLVGQ